MTEDDVVGILRSYIEGRFPKICSSCGRRFGSLREYLLATTHVGMPIVYETGTMFSGPLAWSHANCACGTTLTVGSEEIPPEQMTTLLEWAGNESARRSIDVRELLDHLRDRIDAEVLKDPV